MTTDDYAAAADRRQQRIAAAETIARAYTGPLVCQLCDRAINPDSVHAIPCGCPAPIFLTVDRTIDALQSAVYDAEAAMRASLEREASLITERDRACRELASLRAAFTTFIRAADNALAIHPPTDPTPRKDAA